MCNALMGYATNMVRLKQCTLRTREENDITMLYASKEHHTSLGQLAEETELHFGSM